jgi:2-amino-4-hydroxy-6-hydroxymethyldihydropteridine diphosphokinase
MPSGPIVAYIGLGANLGQPAQTLDRALAALAQSEGVRDLAASPYYRSAPVAATGPDFINAVARVATQLTPLALLDTLQAIEQRFGRERPYTNAPRTLDLDLLLYADWHIADPPRLIVPHPRMHERAFVLRPLLDLDPDRVLPLGRASDLLALCGDQKIELFDFKRLYPPASD